MIFNLATSNDFGIIGSFIAANILLILICVIVWTITFIVFLTAVFESAKRKGRSPIGWTLLAIFGSSLACLLVLHCLGDKKPIEEQPLRKW